MSRDYPAGAIAEEMATWHPLRMQTGRAIIAGAIIIAATGAATAWAVQPRYSLTNVGGGTSIRLNRASGDMIGCARLQCRPIVKGDGILKVPAEIWPGNEVTG